jgi:hypothetical protein
VTRAHVHASHNIGLVYKFGGSDARTNAWKQTEAQVRDIGRSIQCYNPQTNSWTMKSNARLNMSRREAAAIFIPHLASFIILGKAPIIRVSLIL